MNLYKYFVIPAIKLGISQAEHQSPFHFEVDLPETYPGVIFSVKVFDGPTLIGSYSFEISLGLTEDTVNSTRIALLDISNEILTSSSSLSPEKEDLISFIESSITSYSVSMSTYSQGLVSSCLEEFDNHLRELNLSEEQCDYLRTAFFNLLSDYSSLSRSDRANLKERLFKSIEVIK